MSEQENQNPFSVLSCGENEENGPAVTQPRPLDRPSKGSCNTAENEMSLDLEKHGVSHFYEDVFKVTLSKDPCCQARESETLLYLNEVYVAIGCQRFLDENSIDRAVFERLLLEDPSQNLASGKKTDNSEACEKRVMYYLYQSYYRLKKRKKAKIGPYETAHHVIITQTAGALCNSEMFPDSNLGEDLMNLVLENFQEYDSDNVLSQFLTDVTDRIEEMEHVNTAEVLQPFFACLQTRLAAVTLSDPAVFSYINVMDLFTMTETFLKAFLRNSMPKELKNGKAYQNSLLGLPMGISTLPKTEFEKYEHFQEPSKYSGRDHQATQLRLQTVMVNIAKNVHQLFDKILRKSADTRDILLRWIGGCLDANSGRAKIWNSQLPEVYAALHGSDGFFINFTAVMLLLCKPFSDPNSPRLSKIDTMYCNAPLSTDKHRNGVHIKSIKSETCLLPRDDPMKPDETIYNFMTECFFGMHYAIRVGFQVVNEKMMKLNQDMIKTQRLYEDAVAQGGENSEIVVRLKEAMERGMTKFLSYRAAILVPENLEQLIKFQIATASWLVSSAVPPELNVFQNLHFPSNETTSPTLSYIPEFVLENVIDCVIFMKRFSPKTLELQGPNLDYLMTLVLMFMGSSERVKNPHLRAHLAEMLEALMPQTDDETKNLLSRRNSFLSSVYREKLFTSHLFVGELVPTLLNVFVSIEMTGQSVAFEQKFQYRRPMYIVLDYLWSFDVHKGRMKEIAEEAEKNMESPHPPLFLHFINLLINDAIFLLDEALSYMSKLRELQQARDGGQWAGLPADQQQQQEGNLQHMGTLAKFHNVMSNETIHTLQWLTEDIKSIFCHAAIVERIAAMLNYFLLTLVGPQKKNFKVKDLGEYEFKPQELVQDICRIYHNLGSPGDTPAECFCSAVSRDGRSYSSELFPLAQGVLNKIYQGELASKIQFVALKVHELAIKQQQDDELMSNAPDEFLDPIMSTIMKDPVKLPSSGVTLDRATIARHLLSDQTDPFNRSPLTMDMVVTDEDLKSRMQKWFDEQRSKS